MWIRDKFTNRKYAYSPLWNIKSQPQIQELRNPQIKEKKNTKHTIMG